MSARVRAIYDEFRASGWPALYSLQQAREIAAMPVMEEEGGGIECRLTAYANLVTPAHLAIFEVA